MLKASRGDAQYVLQVSISDLQIDQVNSYQTPLVANSKSQGGVNIRNVARKL